MAKQFSKEDKQKKVEAILELLRDGQSLTSACKNCGVGTSTVSYWLSNDGQLFDRYIQARAIGQELAIDRLSELAATATHNDWKAVKVQCETERWRISKLSKRFNDRLAVEHSGSVDVVPVLNISLHSAAPQKNLVHEKYKTSEVNSTGQDKVLLSAAAVDAEDD